VVGHVSEELLACRRKALRARIAALAEPGKQGVTARQVTALRKREQELNTQGIPGILSEFGVPDDICR